MASSRGEKRVLVLLGAHRSGTSLAARALEALGLRLGEDLIPGHADNPEGFWEHRGVLEHTREIERAFDLNPFRGANLLPPEGEWWKGHGAWLEKRIDALARLIADEANKPGTFGFKDPRTLVLLPVWQEVFRRAGIEAEYVALMRHPGAVAASVSKRQNMEATYGEYIWLAHWSYAVHYLERPPARVLHFESWLAEPGDQIAAARELLGDDAVAPEAGEQAVHELMRPDLAHHRPAPDGSGLMPETAALYRDLCALPDSQAWGHARSTAADALDRHRRFMTVHQSVAKRASRLERQLGKRDEEIGRLREKTRTMHEASGQEGAVQEAEGVEPRPAEPYSAEFPDLGAFINRREAPGRKLRICIATEDIVGPIRNGGIGTTYFYLARMLAEAGHDTSIVYVRGNHCENKSIEHWVNYYAEFGVRFVALDTEAQRFNCIAPRWMRPMVALYEHLKSEHYDLVHVSEWRGTGFIAQSARAQGIALQDTLFCVKTSSPWLWNREYGFQAISDLRDLPKMHAERRSVELGDLVVGGSRHLLCWMLEHGYRVPAEHTYVQPNVMVPLDLDDVAAERRKSYGSRMKVDELVFFGRLEYRKGLDVFCDAIDILLDRGVKLPDIHLLGKYGEAIPSYSELTTQEYIKHRSARWPMNVHVHIDRDTEGALRFLLEGKRLAVMPSIIENSSLAVYETAYYAIPFVASNRGGTPELVRSADREAVLTEPHPVPLAAKLEEALDQGGFIARPSFSNDANLATWRRFHAAVGAYLDEVARPVAESEELSVSVCLAVTDDHERAAELIERLDGVDTDHRVEVVLADNGSRRKETRNWLSKASRRQDRRVALETLEPWGEAHAKNRAAERASGELLVFMDEGALPRDEYYRTIARAAGTSGAQVLACYYDEVTRSELREGKAGGRQVLFADDLTYGYFDPDNVSPVLAVRRDAFRKMGGFREDYKVPGATKEFLADASLSALTVVTVPEPLAWLIIDEEGKKRLNYQALPFRANRPYLEHAPQCYSRILMAGRSGASTPPAGRRSGTAIQSAADPTQEADTRARELAGEMAGFSGLRSFGWRAYNAQLRAFERVVRFEIAMMRAVVRGTRRLMGR